MIVDMIINVEDRFITSEVSAGKVERMDAETASRIFKALSDPNRLSILNAVSGSEQCACNLLETMDITQPTLSHHMKVLSEAGLVTIRQEGKWSHYSLNADSIESVRCYLQTLGQE